MIALTKLLKKYPSNTFYYATTKAKKIIQIFLTQTMIFFVFGKETKGLPKDLIEKNLDTAIKIPMKSNLGRSLNLANSVNIILFEALRQLNFF